MSELIAVVGLSGSGKTTSIRNLDPNKTFIISTTGKRPGIPGAKRKYKDVSIVDKKIVGNFYTTSNINNITKMMTLVDKTRPEVNVLIIDDFQYLQAFESMNRVDEKGYTKFTDIAKHAYEALKLGMSLRDDLFVVIMTHSENEGDSLNEHWKIKTIGKMLDNTITLEGLFSYVLFTKIVKDENNNVHYKFVTNSDGTTTAKTPMGMFPQEIDNDLKIVVETIDKYNNEDDNESKQSDTEPGAGE